MQQFELLTEEQIFAGDAELVDITEELFGLVDELKDGEMLCNPEIIDLEETMSAFEFGCPKMDIRKDRNNCLTPQKAHADNLMPLA
jgi:hypothetical protein